MAKLMRTVDSFSLVGLEKERCYSLKVFGILFLSDRIAPVDDLGPRSSPPSRFMDIWFRSKAIILSLFLSVFFLH
jgi:hypothetical protein